MRKAEVFIHDQLAGHLIQESTSAYKFEYLKGFNGPPISMTMPVKNRLYTFDKFPPFFDGLLPEGFQLSMLLKTKKIDQADYFSQLTEISDDFVGAVSIHEVTS